MLVDITIYFSIILSIIILIWFFRGMVSLINIYLLLKNTWICPKCGFRNSNSNKECSRCKFYYFSKILIHPDSDDKKSSDSNYLKQIDKRNS